ncbi:MAG TPA: hypothetical protein VNV15_06320 [Opitutaceae bacterium]|jgi:hypothetical protein|nr:hypothetical protein [Opitutaceae bacterium]
MSRPPYEPGHLRHLAAALRSEAKVIERHNQGLKNLEHETGVYFPVEHSTNKTRVKNLNDAADVLEALADKKIVVAEN